MTRGEKNKNLGNIKIANNDWKGKIPEDQNTDGVFEQFETEYYGNRALVILLQNYINRGINTIDSIINTYAPKSENETAIYVDYVKLRMGFTTIGDAGVDGDHIPQLATAIVEFENGKSYPGIRQKFTRVLLGLKYNDYLKHKK